MTEKNIVVKGRGDKWYFNIKHTRIVRDDALIFVYYGDNLVAMFDLGAIDAFWISENK